MNNQEKLESLLKTLTQKAHAFLEAEQDLSVNGNYDDMAKHDQFLTDWQVATNEYITLLRIVRKNKLSQLCSN